MDDFKKFIDDIRKKAGEFSNQENGKEKFLEHINNLSDDLEETGKNDELTQAKQEFLYELEKELIMPDQSLSYNSDHGTFGDLVKIVVGDLNKVPAQLDMVKWGSETGQKQSGSNSFYKFIEDIILEEINNLTKENTPQEPAQLDMIKWNDKSAKSSVGSGLPVSPNPIYNAVYNAVEEAAKELNEQKNKKQAPAKLDKVKWDIKM